MSVTAVPLRPIKKGSVAKLWIGLGALALAAGAFAWWGTAQQLAADPATFLARNAEREDVQVTASGLQMQTLEAGNGVRPGPNDMVLVEYEGRLMDGSVFDASARHGGPAPLPVSGVIPGWTEALQMMQKGGRYRLWIPPHLAYGEEGAGGGVIPPNAVLEFDVTLVDVAPNAALQMQGLMPGGPEAPPPGGTR